MAATADTAPQLARARSGALRPRILSALVLAPVALGAVWLGGAALTMLAVVAGGLMGWEWARLCGRGKLETAGAATISAIVAATILAGIGLPRLALLLAGGGALLAALLSRRRPGLPLLSAFGALWIALPCIALLWLDAAAGRRAILWILAIVWATDIGAYAVGRTFGGPRLAPRMSPNKTWSGLFGGVVAAMIAGVAVAAAIGAPIDPWNPIVAGLLAVVAQAGDLAESMAKRYFGVKDSSGLIPGHGGVLDRLDGLLAVLPAVAALSLCGGGGVMAWR